MDWLEVFKVVGSASGLISAGFLIYDRVLRWRPLAYLTPYDQQVGLVVKNVADETIVIDEITVKPAIVSLAMANDLRSTVEAAAERMWPSRTPGQPARTYAVLGPRLERVFRFVLRTEFENMPEHTKVVLTTKWHNTPKPFWWPRRVRVNTTIEEIRHLKTVAQAR
jgi:hypothetical protein